MSSGSRGLGRQEMEQVNPLCPLSSDRHVQWVLVSGTELGEHAVSPQPRVPTPWATAPGWDNSWGSWVGHLFSPCRSSAPSRCGDCSCMFVEVFWGGSLFPRSVSFQDLGEGKPPYPTFTGRCPRRQSIASFLQSFVLWQVPVMWWEMYWLGGWS